MAAAIKFYLDENMPVAIAEQLQKRDIEVVTVRDLDVLGDDDMVHLERATKMGCILCTCDTDFIEIAQSGVEHGGIVWGRFDKHNIGDWVKGLERLHSLHSAEDMKNRVEYLQPGKS